MKKIQFIFYSTLLLIAFSCKSDLAKKTVDESSIFKSVILGTSKQDTANYLSTHIESLIIGSWSGIIEGDKLDWNVYPDKTEVVDWYHGTLIQHDQGTWTIQNNILYEKYQICNTICNLEFLTEDHLLLTVLDNGRPSNKNQQRHYYRHSKLPKKDNSKRDVASTVKPDYSSPKFYIKYLKRMLLSH